MPAKAPALAGGGLAGIGLAHILAIAPAQGQDPFEGRDLMAVLDAGVDLAIRDPVAWNSIARAGPEKAWRGCNDAFDIWQPVH